MTGKSASIDLHISTQHDAERLNSRLVEAAQYSLIRRLVPAMRHEIAGAFQPVRMLTKVLEKRLQAAEPDIGVLMKNTRTIDQLSRDASAVCSQLMAWLAPRDEDQLSVSDGVDELIKLLGTGLALRGFTIDIAAAPVHAKLAAGAFRQIFCLCLLALTDLAAAPAHVFISFLEHENDMVVKIRLDTTEGVEEYPVETAYRLIEWDDVQVVADVEAVDVKHLSNGVDLTFQRLKA